jgi:hypothetical protein
MDRRARTSVAVITSLALMGVTIACSVAPEEKIVRDFFRASRLRDNAALGTFATTVFDPQTDGQVQNLTVVSISAERRAPYPIKQVSKAYDDAKAAQDAFAKDKLTYQRANIDAIQRVVEAEAKDKPVTKKDATVQGAWNKWRDDAARYSKAVSDARSALSRIRGLAELSLSRPNGPTPDVTQFDGQLVQKDIAVDATVRTPDGQTAQKPLVVTIERCVGKDKTGASQTGRWIVTHVRPANQQQTT